MYSLGLSFVTRFRQLACLWEPIAPDILYIMMSHATWQSRNGINCSSETFPIPELKSGAYVRQKQSFLKRNDSVVREASSGLVKMTSALAVLSQVSIFAIIVVSSRIVDASAGYRALLSDPGISIAVIEDLPETKPLGFTYEPIAPNFYKLINNITYFEFNGTYYEELNGVFVPAIASTVNGTFTLKPATSIEAAGTDGEVLAFAAWPNYSAMSAVPFQRQAFPT